MKNIGNILVLILIIFGCIILFKSKNAQETSTNNFNEINVNQEILNKAQSKPKVQKNSVDVTDKINIEATNNSPKILEAGEIKEEKEILVNKKTELPIESNGKLYNVEITILESEQNKILSSYDVDISYGYAIEDNIWEKVEKSDKYKTDKDGKIVLKSPCLGKINIKVYTKDYAVFLSDIEVRKKLNKYVVRLTKGGTIKIHATNESNQLINNLKVYASCGSIYLGNTSIEFVMSFDSAKGIYTISNAPSKELNLVFSAIGYKESIRYNITVDSKQTALLEVKLYL